MHRDIGMKGVAIWASDDKIVVKNLYLSTWHVCSQLTFKNLYSAIFKMPGYSFIRCAYRDFY